MRVDRCGPRRPHDRGRTLPRRDRRLACLHPHAVRFARARAVGARARRTTRACRHAGTGAVVRRRNHPAAPRSDRRPAARAVAVRSRRGRGARRRAVAEHVAVRVALPRERGPSPAHPPPPARRAHTVVAAAPARGRPARGRVRLPVVPDAPRDDARVPARRLRPPRVARGARRHPIPQDPRRSRRDQARVAVRAVACCSGGSPSTCTRATRRSPSGARPRSHSTAICCATCSAPRSCASCSIPPCSPTLELELQRLVPARHARNADDLHDLLADLGPLDLDELRARCASDPHAVARRPRSRNGA